MCNMAQRCCTNWRIWIRPVVIVVYVCLLFAVLPYIAFLMFHHGFNGKAIAWSIGGVFAVLSLPITIWEIIMHLIHYTEPQLQKHIIRILWMVPIYALNAWLGLTFPQHSLYMDTIRECYEAYVVYNFMIYILNFLHRDPNFIENLELKNPVKHLCPLCCLPPWRMGSSIIHKCKHGILQYTVVRPITTIISLLCELLGVYNKGTFLPTAAYPYMIAINNLSQFVAMYCLVYFYRATREELSPMKPIAKFFCIKAVIFFSFFQEVIITILVWTGVVSSIFQNPDETDVKSIANGIQDFIVCIEMFIAAIAHYFAFSYKPYINPEYPQADCCQSFLQMWDVSDVHQDVREHLNVVKNSVKKGISGVFPSASSNSPENKPLLDSVLDVDNEAQCSPAKKYDSMSATDSQ